MTRICSSHLVLATEFSAGLGALSSRRRVSRGRFSMSTRRRDAGAPRNSGAPGDAKPCAAPGPFCLVFCQSRFHRIFLDAGNHVFTARRIRNRSSAELYSAVSRICNPLAAAKSNASGKYDVPPNAIRRYSRLQICATPERAAALQPPVRFMARVGFPRVQPFRRRKTFLV